MGARARARSFARSTLGRSFRIKLYGRERTYVLVERAKELQRSRPLFASSPRARDRHADTDDNDNNSHNGNANANDNDNDVGGDKIAPKATRLAARWLMQAPRARQASTPLRAGTENGRRFGAKGLSPSERASARARLSG